MKRLLPLLFVLMILPGRAGAVTVSIPASADATLFGPPLDEQSNGSGDWFFAGVNADGNLRRGLIRFDVAGIVPAGAVVTSAILRLVVDRGRLFPAPVSIYRLEASWTEGLADAPGREGTGSPAQSGGVTWQYRNYGGQTWNTPGGDMAGTPSASTDLTGIGPVTFSDAALTADTQSWLDNPSRNHGWAVRGVEYISLTANRFVSRSSPAAGDRPSLTLTYTVVPEPGGLIMLAGVLFFPGRRKSRAARASAA